MTTLNTCALFGVRLLTPTNLEMEQTEQHLVNGNLLKNYVDQPVHLYLKVESVSSGGNKVIFRTV